MNQNLPDNPSLEHLRAQAKDLLKTLRQTRPETRLHEAQHGLAQSYGFASWPKLIQHVEDLALQGKSLQDAIRTVERGILGGTAARHAIRALELQPQLASASPACAAVALNAGYFAPGMDPNQPTGDLNAPVLSYACSSPLGASHPSGYVETIRALLQLGAIPNPAYFHPAFPNSPLSALYGASGIVRSAEATRILLESGANPNDNESLYHACETTDHACLKLLLAAGAKIDGTNAVLRMMDHEDPSGLALLLEHDPNLESPNALIGALQRSRSQAVVDLLLSAGANPDASVHGISVRQLAFERGYSLGQDYHPSDVDRLLAACWRGDVSAAAELRHVHSDLPKHRRTTFCSSLWAGRSGSVEAFFAGGFTHEDRDNDGSAPLHVACFTGVTKSVEAILRHAPPMGDTKNPYAAIPLQYAMHASENEPRAGEDVDYARVVQMLIEAGSPPPVSNFGSDEVRALVADRWPNLAE